MKTRIILFIIMAAAAVQAEVFLPGTQPEENDIRVAKTKLCKTCHSRTGDANAEPYGTWQGGMMSQASRDPVYLAALAVANQDLPGVGEFCIRCHAPAGWMEGRSKKPDGSDLTDADKYGISCDICHRLVDPLSDEGKKLVKTPAPGYGSGMMVMAPNKIALGPYGDTPRVSSHETRKSEFHASSELCGTCHDVSNPLAAKDIKTDPPASYGVIERTYSEWLLSSYSSGDGKRTCQSCHYPEIEGGGMAARHSKAKHRDYMVQHGPVGASIWVQKAVADLWEGTDGVDSLAMEKGAAKAKAFRKTAAKIEAEFTGSKEVKVKVTNLTGHKLPTGYIEGRRMWVNLKCMDAKGRIIKEIGEYKTVEIEIAGKKVKARDLTDASETHVYECLPGMSKDQAAKYNKKPGKSFHFVLNDIITHDSRIPPKGFDNEKFKTRGAHPIGVKYADGQYWDEVSFKVPRDCVSVKASLVYEPVTMEYIKFLAEQNRSDDWGKKLLGVWQKYIDETAEVIASVEVKR